jgi:GTP 3',8-cyclase
LIVSAAESNTFACRSRIAAICAVPIAFRKASRGFEEPDHWLTFDEIERLLGLFASLGLKRMRLTGGEPLLRRNIVGLVERIATLARHRRHFGFHQCNATGSMAADLKRAGVSRLNVSLDSLRPEIVEKINGRPVLDKILAGLEAAHAAGFAPIKVNMVVMRENADEVDDIVAYCMQRGFILRLIELMPMGDTARKMGYVDLQPVKARLAKALRPDRYRHVWRRSGALSGHG